MRATGSIVKHRQYLHRVFAFTLVASLTCVAVACQAPPAPPPAILSPAAPAGPTVTAPSARLLPPLTTPLAATTPIVGLGVLSDSNSDEYHADDNRGGQYSSVTFSWVELIAARRGLNLGPWGTWGEPRRTGFKYNWSRSGATVHDAIESGQHTGLAAQVASGEVSHVIIWIGTNDFATWNGTYQEIYDGRLSGEALQAKLDAITADLTLAVDTILHAGPVKLLLVTIAEPAISPEMIQQFPDAAGRLRVSEALHTTNTQLITMAAARGSRSSIALHLYKRCFSVWTRPGSSTSEARRSPCLAKATSPTTGDWTMRQAIPARSSRA